MNKIDVFINKKEINEKFEQEKYRNCMDKKYFEYIVAAGKISYIDEFLENSKNKQVIESLVLKNKIVKVIDRLIVRVENRKYIGELEGLGIFDIEISQEIVDKYHKQILTKGIFSLISLEENTDKKYPYYIEEIEVLEDVDVTLDEYREYFSKRVKNYREQKITGIPVVCSPEDYISEIELVLNTIGISTVELTFWEKILYLVRLIPLCEANYNLMELGGNGLGKTKTYSMFSPECEIVQEMLTTELIYNRQSSTAGLLSAKDVVVFDEINKLKLDGDKEKIIPSLLNFMADGQTTAPRKIISKTSFVFSGNVMGIEERLEKNEKNIFDNSHKLEDNAFFDRIHFFLPAWGMRRYSRNIHGLDVSKKVFRFDYFSKALSLLRDEDYSQLLDSKGYKIIGGSEREVRAIRKTVSGLIKLTHPDKEIDDFTLEAYIAVAIKGRGLINKFLHNKNKNNIAELDIRISKVLLGTDGIYREADIPVNELLKRMIYIDNLSEIDRYYSEQIEKHNITYLNYYNVYSYDQYIKNFNYNPYQNHNFQQQKLYEGKYYPNRHIIPISNIDGSHVFYIKIALDKIGIERNKREYIKIELDKIKESNLFIRGEYRESSGRILIIEAATQKRQILLLPSETEATVTSLMNPKELNYDGLFGGIALDLNKFNDIVIEGSQNLELDFSNFFQLDLNKRIKCKHCNQEIIPQYMYNNITGNYHYICKSPMTNGQQYNSESMNYVEFKYFLRDNNIIKF